MIFCNSPKRGSSWRCNNGLELLELAFCKVVYIDTHQGMLLKTCWKGINGFWLHPHRFWDLLVSAMFTCAVWMCMCRMCRTCCCIAFLLKLTRGAERPVQLLGFWECSAVWRSRIKSRLEGLSCKYVIWAQGELQVVTCESLQSLCNRYCCFRFVNTACRVPKTAHVANQQFTLWTSSPSPSSLDLCEKVSAKRLAEGETRGCLGSRRKSDAKNLQFQWFCMHSRLEKCPASSPQSHLVAQGLQCTFGIQWHSLCWLYCPQPELHLLGLSSNRTLALWWTKGVGLPNFDLVLLTRGLSICLIWPHMWVTRLEHTVGTSFSEFVGLRRAAMNLRFMAFPACSECSQRSTAISPASDWQIALRQCSSFECELKSSDRTVLPF